MNWALPSLHEESIKITLTVPLKELQFTIDIFFKMLGVHCSFCGVAVFALKESIKNKLKKF